MTTNNLPITDVNRWFPADYNRGPNIIVWIALLSCFITVLIKLNTSVHVNRWPEAITTLLFLYPLITNWNTLKKSIWLKLWALAIVAPLLFFAWNYFFWNAELAVKYSDFEKLPRIYLFIPIAWWLGGNSQTIAVFLACAVIGFAYCIFSSPDFISDVHNALQGKRVDFAWNWEHISLLCAITLIGVFSYGRHQWHWVNPKKTVLIYTFLSIFGIGALLGLIATQTRAAYLGLLIALCIYVALKIVKVFKNSDNRNQITPLRIAITAIILIALTGITGQFLVKNVAKRVVHESSTLTAVINQDWDNIPYNSAGIRINTWLQAAQWIQEKPFIGYGGKVRTHIIPQSTKHSAWVKENIGHFHNSFIEFALGYGLLGLALALVPFICVFNKIHNMPHIQTFAFYSCIVFLVMNAFESYLFFWFGPFILTLLLAPVFRLHRPTNLENKHID